MTIALAGVAVLVVAGGVVAASARDPRYAVLGLLAALTLGAFVSDPIPHPTALAVRVVAALLAAAAIRSVIAPGRSVGGGGGGVGAASSVDIGATGGTALGWASTALLATAGAAVLVALAGALAGAPLPADGSSPGTVGPPVAIVGTAGPPILAATGGALLACGLAPMLLARSVGRATVGLLLAAEAAILVRGAIVGTPPDVEQVGFVILIVAISLGGAALGQAERREIAAMRRPRAMTPGDPVADVAEEVGTEAEAGSAPLREAANPRPTTATGAVSQR